MRLKRNNIYKKVKRHYRLSFYSENTLNKLWSIKFTRAKVVVCAIVITLAFVSLISTVIVSTPLRTLLPGYIKNKERHEYITTNITLDSLENVIANRNLYFENITAILNDEVALSDSVPTTLPSDSTQNTIIDSLVAASAAETNFVREFDEREQFNIAVLTPLSAERLIFATPVAGEIVASKSGNTQSTPNEDLSDGIKITVKKGSPVSAIYDGTVIAFNHTISNGAEIIIQHIDGFISSYKNIGVTYVKKGEKVVAAQHIGNAIDTTVGIELWHNGIPVNPSTYIPF